MRRRLVLITGASSGIGQALAREFAANGWDLALTARRKDRLDALAEEIKTQYGVDSLVIAADLSKTTAPKKIIEAIEAEGRQIDGLVNNAGVTRDGMFHKMTPEDWNDVIRIDLTSMFNMTRPIIDGMRERGFGRIINISSINGQKGQMGQVNYSAAKAGVIGFTKALAQETARKGITVNCIAPGYINTDMVAAVPANFLQFIIAAIPVTLRGDST